MSLEAAIDQIKTVSLPAPLPVPVGDLAPAIVGALSALEVGDWWVPGLRERAGGVLRGAPEERLSSLHGARPYRMAPISLAPALRALYAVGLADSDSSRAVLVHLGPGSIADGAFYEALNLAVRRKAHVLFLVNLPSFGENTPVSAQLNGDISAIAAGFGIPVHRVDRNDANAVRAGVSQARLSTGPQLILAVEPT